MKYLNLSSNDTLDIITNKLYNIFLTGAPGSGKTWITNKYIDYWKNKGYKIAITASTGISSKLLNGTTIHSWSGINIINENDDFDKVYKRILNNKKKIKEWKNIDIIILDEISLIDVKTFDILNKIGQNIRKNNKPFGGIKLFIVGDFFQLPPVNGNYCFTYDEWENIFDYGINLIENHRSNDNKLNNILSKIRRGKKLSEEMELELENKLSLEEHYPLLVPLRNMARKINNDKLIENNNIEYNYKATYYYDKNKPYLKDIIDRCSPLEEELILKIGCPVIHVINNHEKRIMNGDVGEIVDFINNNPIVKFTNGKYIIDKHMWEKEIDENTKIYMEQYPLLLAYSITIHRSQGQTLSQASMILDNNVWERGQGYVALSRLQSLNGLYLLKYSPNIFKVDKQVKKYYKLWDN
jgi:ATP-dependent exoDNAse (exonuclease V) alpha subunit